jgi:hypothetical protein
MTEIEMCNEHSGVCVRVTTLEREMKSTKALLTTIMVLLVANLAGIITVLIKGVK